MWFLNRVVNPLVRALLRSPLHPLLSGRLVLLRITGRRSGREFELPVIYTRDDADLIVSVAAPARKRWWRNVEGATPITIVLRGRTLPAVAERMDGDDARPRFRITPAQPHRSARAPSR